MPPTPGNTAPAAGDCGEPAEHAVLIVPLPAVAENVVERLVPATVAVIVTVPVLDPRVTLALATPV